MGAKLLHNATLVKEYTLELTSIERHGQTIYRLRMRWSLGNGYQSRHRYRKTWKYRLFLNAVSRLYTLIDHYGEPKEVTFFGFRANIAELGLRGSGRWREPQ